MWRGLLPCPLFLVAQDQLCVGGGDCRASWQEQMLQEVEVGSRVQLWGLFLGLCLHLSKDGNHLERRAWVAKDRVTPVQGHLRLSHERGLLPRLSSIQLCGTPEEFCERLFLATLTPPALKLPPRRQWCRVPVRVTW